MPTLKFRMLVPAMKFIAAMAFFYFGAFFGIFDAKADVSYRQCEQFFEVNPDHPEIAEIMKLEPGLAVKICSSSGPNSQPIYWARTQPKFFEIGVCQFEEKEVSKSESGWKLGSPENENQRRAYSLISKNNCPVRSFSYYVFSGNADPIEFILISDFISQLKAAGEIRQFFPITPEVLKNSLI